MRRRAFLKLAGGTAIMRPLAAFGQPAGRVRHVAWLGYGETAPYIEALRAGLKDHGWIEGRTLRLSLYWAERADMDGVARELVAAGPEVVVTQELMTFALYNVQPSPPVVFGFSGDPVYAKLVQSWARPGGNFTGISYLALDLVGKRIEILKQWRPDTRHLAILARPQHPGEPRERQVSEQVSAQLGLQQTYYPLLDPAELDDIFRAIRRDGCDALVVFPDASMFQLSDRIARFAQEARMPTLSGWTRFAVNGLLFTYGPNLRDLYRSLARYADRILRGATPAELPIELPTTYEFAINLKTANAIGLPPPPALLATAHTVIE